MVLLFSAARKMIRSPDRFTMPIEWWKWRKTYKKTRFFYKPRAVWGLKFHANRACYRNVSGSIQQVSEHHLFRLLQLVAGSFSAMEEAIAGEAIAGEGTIGVDTTAAAIIITTIIGHIIMAKRQFSALGYSSCLVSKPIVIFFYQLHQSRSVT